MEIRYLVDNNVLNALRRDQIHSEFFRDYCQVTADVLWEAREHSERAALALHSRPHTTGFLMRMRDVMETLEAGDTRLIDLYGNKGAADPGLIASILEAADDDANKLLSDSWILVTNDQAVAGKAAEFAVAVITPIEFAKLIDDSLL